MKPFLLCLTLSLTFTGATFAQETELYEVCRDKIAKGGYGSSDNERLCKEKFDMPDAYLVKCLDWVKKGNFPDPSDKIACRYYCRSNQNWGPWYDYEIPHELKPLLFTMKSLHDRNQCFIDICPDLSGIYENAGRTLIVRSEKNEDGFRSYQLNDEPPLLATGRTVDTGAGTSYQASCTHRSVEIARTTGEVTVKKTLTLTAGQLEISDSTGKSRWTKK